VAKAARVRLRPILMTTIATVAGHMPLVFVTGAGAHARNSIGLVLVGGMSIGTIFTLFIVPSLYVLIARTHDEGAKEKATGAREPKRPREPGFVPEFADA
jgi:multidrug efflux pump